MTPTTTKRRAILSDLAEQLAAAAAALERVNTLACELHDALAHDDVTDDDFDTAEEITDDLHPAHDAVTEALKLAAAAFTLPTFTL